MTPMSPPGALNLHRGDEMRERCQDLLVLVLQVLAALISPYSVPRLKGS